MSTEELEFSIDRLLGVMLERQQRVIEAQEKAVEAAVAENYRRALGAEFENLRSIARQWASQTRNGKAADLSGFWIVPFGLESLR